MEINKKKSGILFKYKAAHDWAVHFFPNGFHGFPIVLEYKYLGVIWDRNLTLKSHFREIRKKSMNAIYAINGAKGDGSLLFARLVLWKTLCRSYITYGCSIWDSLTVTAKNNWLRIYRSSLKLALGLPKSFPNDIISKLTKTTPLETVAI